MSVASLPPPWVFIYVCKIHLVYSSVQIGDERNTHNRWHHRQNPRTAKNRRPCFQCRKYNNLPEHKHTIQQWLSMFMKTLEHPNWFCAHLSLLKRSTGKVFLFHQHSGVMHNSKMLTNIALHIPVPLIHKLRLSVHAHLILGVWDVMS